MSSVWDDPEKLCGALRAKILSQGGLPVRTQHKILLHGWAYVQQLIGLTSTWSSPCPMPSTRWHWPNPGVVYDLLSRWAAETVLEVAANPERLGARTGVLAVLHTWGQTLKFHPHVHCVVTGGGPSPDNTGRIAAPLIPAEEGPQPGVPRQIPGGPSAPPTSAGTQSRAGINKAPMANLSAWCPCRSRPTGWCTSNAHSVVPRWS